MKKPNPTYDVQIGLELNKAIMAGNGDAAALAFADAVRSRQLTISKDAWAYLNAAIAAQQSTNRVATS